MKNEMKYPRLRELIKSHKESYGDFAIFLGISYSALNYKFIGKQGFTKKQIKMIQEHYKLSATETFKIFFE